jgi:hypothetical protein
MTLIARIIYKLIITVTFTATVVIAILLSCAMGIPISYKNVQVRSFYIENCEQNM